MLGRRRAAHLVIGVGLALASAMLPATAAASGRVLIGAGDIAVCGSSVDEATAALLRQHAGTVFTTGDNAYPNGTLRQFRACYDPGWGVFRGRTRPSPGNHDYRTPDAAGYQEYFGWRAGPGDRGYYAFDRGPWRIYSLNSERVTDAQLAWLASDLASHPRRCSLAYWHRPRFSSGEHGNNAAMGAFWRPLHRAGLELVVNGHDHDYERFAPQRPNGTRHWKGIREFVVGTGGVALREFTTVRAHSIVRQATAHGVLKLVLGDGRYRWRFISVDGSFSDSGGARCHGKP